MLSGVREYRYQNSSTYPNNLHRLDLWALVHATCSDEGGPYRVTTFDSYGFTGHTFHASLDACTEHLCSERYINPDPGALDRVASGWQAAL